MRHWVVIMLFLFALGALRVVACGEEDVSCVDDEDCDDGNPCTRKRSDPRCAKRSALSAIRL